jgi:hypothetical protein
MSGKKTNVPARPFDTGEKRGKPRGIEAFHAIKAAAALALAALTALSLFACRPGTGGDPAETGGPVKRKLEHVYKGETIALMSGGTSDLINAELLDVVNGRAYFGSYRGGVAEASESGDDGGSGYTETYEILSIAADGGDAEPTLCLSVPAGQHKEPGDGENSYRHAYIGMAAHLRNGAFALVSEESYEDYSDEMNPVYESKTMLRLFDAGWNETAAIDLKEAVADDEYRYIGVYGIVAADDDTLYLNCGEFVLALDGTGGRLFALKPEENTYFEGIARFSDGRVAICAFKSGEKGTSRAFAVIDKATRGWGEEIPFTMPRNVWGSVYLTGEGEYLLYHVSSQGVYGLLPGGESEEVVSFMNSDIDGNTLGALKNLGGGEFLTYTYDYDTGARALLKLSPVPDAENKEKIVLTVATLYGNYDFKRHALKFNRNSGEYKITIEDYSAYNTDGQPEVGISKLKADLITGKVPDILILNEQLDIPMLANKGLLADLYELIDASDKVSREDFLESVFKADEIDGKLYRFIPSFSIQTVAAKRSIVGDAIGWTLDDMERVLAGMPEGTKSFFMMDRANALVTGMELGMSQFIDWGTGTCSFGENFERLLEFASGFPETLDYNNWTEEDWTRYMTYQRDDLAILSSEGISSYRTIREIEERVGEEITFVGFPTYKGSGSRIWPNEQYALSARGEHRATCFDFLLSLVETEPDIANSGGYFYGSFSLSREYMDKLKKYEMTPLPEREGYIPRYAEGGTTADYNKPAPDLLPADAGTDVPDYEANYHLTRAEADAVDALIASTTQIYADYSEVMGIVSEEAANYFAGRKTAEETAKLVQSRVQIYISESR